MMLMNLLEWCLLGPLNHPWFTPGEGNLSYVKGHFYMYNLYSGNTKLSTYKWPHFFVKIFHHLIPNVMAVVAAFSVGCDVSRCWWYCWGVWCEPVLMMLLLGCLGRARPNYLAIIKQFTGWTFFTLGLENFSLETRILVHPHIHFS